MTWMSPPIIPYWTNMEKNYMVKEAYQLFGSVYLLLEVAFAELEKEVLLKKS